jgi:RNase P/RNase MRP subunit p29
MKYLLFTVALFLCVNITAQELPKKSKIFVRVYNNQGKKIAKGKILKITDSTLVLKKGSKSITVPSSEISYIKTKKTKGHSVLMGALPGVALLIISDDGYAAAGSIFLTFVGTSAGFIASLFKKSTTYSFTGDIAKWKGFKKDMYSPQKY